MLSSLILSLHNSSSPTAKLRRQQNILLGTGKNISNHSLFLSKEKTRMWLLSPKSYSSPFTNRFTSYLQTLGRCLRSWIRVEDLISRLLNSYCPSSSYHCFQTQAQWSGTGLWKRVIINMRYLGNWSYQTSFNNPSAQEIPGTNEQKKMSSSSALIPVLSCRSHLTWVSCCLWRPSVKGSFFSLLVCKDIHRTGMSPKCKHT